MKKKTKKQRRRRRTVSYKPIWPEEVFEFRPESATEQNDNAAKKKEEEDEEAKKKKKKKKGVKSVKTTTAAYQIHMYFWFYVFFFFYFRPISFFWPKHTDIRPIRSNSARVWGASARVREKKNTWQDAARRGTDARSVASLAHRRVGCGFDSSGAVSVHPKWKHNIKDYSVLFCY